MTLWTKGQFFFAGLIHLSWTIRLCYHENLEEEKILCFDNTAEEVYDRSIESSDDLKSVNKAYFTEGYDLQTKELSHVLKKSLKSK